MYINDSIVINGYEYIIDDKKIPRKFLIQKKKAVKINISKII